MTSKEYFNFETMIFDYIEEFKILFFPEQWIDNAFLDYSKNELLALLFLYRKKSANMTELSNYMQAPLNTATGVVSRLEKKKMIERRRDETDRRIVNIVLTNNADEFIKQEKDIILEYLTDIYTALTEEEKVAALKLINKVMSILKQSKSKTQEEGKIKKVRRINIE